MTAECAASFEPRLARLLTPEPNAAAPPALPPTSGVVIHPFPVLTSDGAGPNFRAESAFCPEILPPMGACAVFGAVGYHASETCATPRKPRDHDGPSGLVRVIH
ncbi:hypothetical protein MRX96_027245 [Rhipicephalus microplus]